tara:strand:- start:50 stop:1498 length:1449 start_codon:yes stop_codon:yes gene_type:complete
MSKPNILFISSDQHRADTLGCAGHPVVRTPHLDGLAYEGVRFNRAYTNCPVCIPARTSLVTGVQAHHYGMPSYNDEYRIDHPRDQFLGSLLTQGGYQTHLAGKTHWHTEPQFRGGFESVTWMSQLRRERLIQSGRSTTLDGMGFNEMTPTLSEVPPELQMSNWIVDRSLDFLDTRDRDQPFFLWASFQDPHPPLSIHQPFYDMYRDADIPLPTIPDWCDSPQCPAGLYNHRWSWNPKPLSEPEIRDARAIYYGMVSNLDYQLGRLFAKLQLDGDWENTVIVYTSDHGDHLGDCGDIAKSTFLESSANIPLIIRPPMSESYEKGAISDALVDLTDLLPTFCSYGEQEVPSDIDGKDLRPVLTGDTQSIRNHLHGQIEDMHMFHNGEYKYLYFADDGSELAFQVSKDPQDESPITGPVLEHLRREFIQHLQSENHPHLDADGTLLNKGKGRLPKNELAARHILLQGLAPAAIHSDMLSRVTWIH